MPVKPGASRFVSRLGDLRAWIGDRVRGRWGCLWIVLGICLLVALLVGLLVIPPFWRIASRFSDVTYRQPSRLYARPIRLTVGFNTPVEQIVALLREEGYGEDTTSAELPAGRMRATPEGLAIHLRDFRLPDGSAGGGTVEVLYQRAGRLRISQLLRNGERADSVTLEPLLLASFYGPNLQERRPVALKDVSPDLLHAILAAEDASFFSHAGISVSGLMRAAWVNLRGGEVRQGGSTLTQQLVKNLFLTHERTLTRKAQEILLALLLDLRFSKEQILEAYVNEIYMGGSGGVSLLGVGAASRAFFGKDASQLNLAEAATLAGMIRSPANYSPIGHPDRTRERRDWVLGRLAELKLAPPEQVQAALEEPVRVVAETPARKRTPYFADAMALEAARRYGLEDLPDGGYALFSTLDWRSQRTAQEAVDWGLAAVEKGYQRGSKEKEPLQAALVSVDPRDGGILSYLGGRSYEGSQFDRAGQAQRPVGSSFKPIVYAALFEAGEGSPASFIEDAPLSFQLAGQDEPWSPKNDDGEFHGWVTVRTAIEKSYNLATVRIALRAGLNRIADLAQEMGVTTKLGPYPSLALGAADISPLDLSSVYATLAAGGVRPTVHGLTAVLNRYGRPIAGASIPAPKRVLSAQSSYLVTSLLQGVLQRGTAAGAANGIAGDLAGKTGTTNRRRDSWFAGYAVERATVVWVGYDNNATTRLSGARAALPIWVRFMARSAPATGYSRFLMPPGLTTATIDPTTGMLATEFCPDVLTEVFREKDVPTASCDRHTTFEEGQMALDGQPSVGPDGTVEPGGVPSANSEDGGRFRRWLRRVFGRDRKPPEPPPTSPPPPEPPGR